MRIASWNVNSVRTRLSHVTKWLESAGVDVLLLQEIKCPTDDFPRFEIEALGYKTAIFGQKSYNGVAIISKTAPKDVITALPAYDDPQARYIEATIEGIRIASVYAPNGNPLGTEKYDYKMSWMNMVKLHVEAYLKSEKPFVLGGDFNVIPTEDDVYDPKDWEQDALFTPQTRAAWREILNLGVTDAFRALYPDKTDYTFWAYQNNAWQRDLGLRIDHFLLSPETADRLQSCTIDRTPRGAEQPSDHTPIMINLD